jgi:hypothetical protein
MPEPQWTIVCEPEAATALRGADFCSGTRAGGGSPIDDYYEYVEHLLTFGGADELAASATLGRLLVLGLVSGVEAYFRGVLTALLKICPLARSHAADQQLPFGAIDYYGLEGVELGLFDRASFASAKNICGQTRNLLGIQIPDRSSVKAALDEFDKVCHLRHAAVHARGAIGRGNAAALGLDRADGLQALSVSFPALQSAGLACHSAVRAYNRFVYKKTVERWLAAGQMTRSWRQDKVLYQPLFDLFRSKRDSVGPSRAYDAYRAL